MPVPDGSKLLSNYLRNHSAVSALGTRIVGQTPGKDDRTTSWVRVTQLDAPSVGNSHPSHHFEFYFQLDCYAGVSGGQPEVTTLARTIHDALAELTAKNYQASGVTFSGANPNMGLWAPDTDFEPARERYILTATVWAHG